MPGKGRVKTTERRHLPAVLERLTPAPSSGGTPPPLPDATGGVGPCGGSWSFLVLPGEGYRSGAKGRRLLSGRRACGCGPHVKSAPRSAGGAWSRVTELDEHFLRPQEEFPGGGGGSDFPGDASGCWARDPEGGAAPDRLVTSVLECTRGSTCY